MLQPGCGFRLLFDWRCECSGQNPAVFYVYVILNEQSPCDFRTVERRVGKTAENKVCIGLVNRHFRNHTQPFIEVIPIGLYLFTAFDKFLAIPGHKPQKLFGKAVDIPNMYAFTYCFGKSGICREHIAEPQTTDTKGFAHAFKDCHIGAMLDVLFQCRLITILCKIDEGFIHDQHTVMLKAVLSTQ